MGKKNNNTPFNKKLKQYIWGTGTGILARVCTYGGGFISVYLLIRILGAEAYGGYVTGLVILELVHLITNCGLDKNISYRIPRLKEQSSTLECNRFFTRAIITGLVVSTAGASLIYLIISEFQFLSLQYPQLISWLSLLVILIPVLTLKDLLAEWLIANNNVPEKHYLFTIIPRILFVFLLLMIYFSNRSHNTFVAIALLIAHGAPVTVWFLKETRLNLLNRPPQEQIDWAFSIRMSFNDLVKNSLWKVDVLFVYYFLGSTPAGGYKIASQLAKVAKLADELTTQIFKPLIGSYLEKNQWNQLRNEYNYLRITTLHYALLYTIFLIMIGKTILIFFGPYGHFYPVLVLLSFSYCVVISFGNIGNLLVMEGEAGWVLRSSVVGMTLNIAGNVILIPFLGIMGAGIATGTSLILQNTVALIGVRVELNQNMLKIDDFLLPFLGLSFVIFAELYLTMFSLNLKSLLFIPILHLILNLTLFKKSIRRFEQFIMNET